MSVIRMQNCNVTDQNGKKCGYVLECKSEVEKIIEDMQKLIKALEESLSLDNTNTEIIILSMRMWIAIHKKKQRELQ